MSFVIRAAKASDNMAIKLLLQYHALVDLPNAMGVTPLMAAAGLGQSDNPTRGRYKTEAEGIELRLAQSELQAEYRKRMLLIGGALILVLLFWRGYAEYQARVILGQVSRFATILGLVAMIVVFSILSPFFLSVSNMLQIGGNVAYIGQMAAAGTPLIPSAQAASFGCMSSVPSRYALNWSNPTVYLSRNA